MIDNVVILRSGGGPSLVCVHPASGVATAFRRLVQYWPDGGAAFAFENLEPQGEPPTLRDLSERYWEQLDASGPLFFVGWSFGGAVALELSARALQQQREVSGVVLLDAGAPHLLAASRLPIHELAGLFGLSASDIPADLNPPDDTESLRAVVRLLRHTGIMAAAELSDLEPFVRTYRWHHAVARRPWTFGGQDAPVFLVRARDESGWSDAPADLGWTRVLGHPPELLWTPGTHHTVVSPEHAPALARLLAGLMNRASR